MTELVHLSDSFSAMGGTGSIHAHGPPATLPAALDDAIAEVLRIEVKYSRYRDDNEWARLQREADQGGATQVDSETAALLDYAFALHARSGGRFDLTSGILRRVWDFNRPRLPDPREIDALLPFVGMQHLRWEPEHARLAFARSGMEIDFGGIGKEYAVDRAADVLAAHGVQHALVEIGGDLRVLGPQADGSAWPVQVRHPRDPDRPCATLQVREGGVATSGDYERFIEVDGVRYSHLLDPRTGWPVHGLSAVTVQARSCLMAGSASTLAMLMGAQGPAWLAAGGLPHLWVDARGRMGGPLAP